MYKRLAGGVGLLGLFLALASSGLGQEEKTKLEKVPAREKGFVDGKELYQTYCAVCHGKEGKGGGPAAGALKSTPTDLTQLSKKSGGKFPVYQVEHTLGGEGTTAHGSKDMPIWGPIFRGMNKNQSLVPLRVNNLTQYLQSIQEK